MQAASALAGPRKAAILALLLGEDASISIFRHLHEDEVERIAREIGSLGSVAPALGEQVLEEFHQMAQAAGYVTRGGADYMEKVLLKALGPETARRIAERVAQASRSTTAFAALTKVNPQKLAKFIATEQPQTIALVLAHLDVTQAAQVLGLLPEAVRAEVLTRIATLDEISPEVVSRICSVIEQRMRVLGNESHEARGGARAVAEMLNRLDRSASQAALEMIESHSPDLAASIRSMLFVFEDLVKVDDSAIREILQHADRRILVIALKGATGALRARFFQNMSKRAGEMMREEMDMLGAVRLREVEKAQQEIVSIARKLEEEGLLQTGQSGEEAYVT